MPPKEDLLSLWMNQHSGSPKEEQQASTPVTEGQHKKPDLSGKTTSTPFPTPEVPPSRRAEAVLSGRLANYLAKQQSRGVSPDSIRLTTEAKPWTIEDPQTKAAVAMALVLASHLAKYASTSLSKSQLNQARDSLMHEMQARDAVNIEGEAYEMLQWFAGAIDESWKKQANKSTIESISETSSEALIQIIQSAIQNHRDLEMQYYTSSRADFSERIVTPIEITAEKYLIAYCHTRKEERVFRLTRILSLAQIANESDSGPLLSYPNLEDTKTPPLPELEIPEPPAPKRKAKPTKKSSQKPQKNAQTRSNVRKTSVSDSAPKSNNPKQVRTLFDVPAKQAAPKSKPKNQSFLPGFDKNEQ